MQWNKEMSKLHYLANPARFSRLSALVLPWLTLATVLLIGSGLYLGLLDSPPDYQQGETVRIMYVHVPAAWMAMGCYSSMAIASAMALIWRHPLADLIAQESAPIGACFTAIALMTGALWGQPMWGTWWVWDPRLTSFLIMFVFYLGYIALWAAIDEPDKAADLTSILALVGTVFAVLSRYAVNFWSQGLHQGASLSMDRAQNVANVYWFPLVLTIVGFFALFIWLLLIGTRSEIRARRLRALEMQGVR